jgi:hypothetical protein
MNDDLGLDVPLPTRVERVVRYDPSLTEATRILPAALAQPSRDA